MKSDGNNRMIGLLKELFLNDKKWNIKTYLVQLIDIHNQETAYPCCFCIGHDMSLYE